MPALSSSLRPPPPLPQLAAACRARRSGRLQTHASSQPPSSELLPPWARRLCAGAVGVAAAAVLSAPASLAISENQLLFMEAWRAVDRAYVDKTFNGQSWFRYREATVKGTAMDTRGETYAAVRAMLATLNDPFTRFLEPEQLAALQGATQGELTGVGLELAPAPGGGTVVVTPAPGGPAEKAGITAGSLLLRVGGEDVRTLSVYEVATLLQGPLGSQVELEWTPGEAQAGGPAKAAAPKRSATLAREPIRLNPVSLTVCEGSKNPKTAYVRLSAFSGGTLEGVRGALEGAMKEGAEAVVLDMRNNGGGSFPAAVEVAKLLLPKSTIVNIADSNGVRDVFEAPGSPLLPVSTPLTLLVNRGTASAAEVLSAALQDNGRALLLGERTYGKGVIQTTVELSDGSGVNVTVAKYQTPGGRDIHQVGIQPDGPSPLPADSKAEGGAFCAALGPEVAAKLWARG